MKTFISSLVLSLALGASVASAAESNQNCYRDVCVGDRIINVLRDYRFAVVVGIDNYGKFVLRFEDNGGVGGNWDRGDLAVTRGCVGDLCVGYPAINIERNYRRVKVAGLQVGNKFVLRFDDNGAQGGNWDRDDLAVAWGCVANLCVNDSVYNRSNSRQARVAAIQTNSAGYQDRMVLDYGASSLGGNWQANDLVLLQRGPTAYPPNGPNPYPYPNPGPNPQCPPGTHWDPRIDRCVANAPGPVPPPSPRNWECTIRKPQRTFRGAGPTRSAALEAALAGCARAGGGYVCRSSEAACRQY